MMLPASAANRLELHERSTALLRQLLDTAWLDPERSRGFDAAVGQAQADLQQRLAGAMQDAFSPDQSLRDAALDRFEEAMCGYAQKLFLGFARMIKASDVDTCMAVLAGNLIPALAEFFESGTEEFPTVASVLDETWAPDGEWERRVELARRIYTPRHARPEGSQIDAWSFAVRSLLRLRIERHRLAFRNKLEAALLSACIQAGAEVSARLPVRKTNVYGIPRRRGRKPKTDEHRRLAEIVRSFGRDWREDLQEICGKIDDILTLPKQFQSVVRKTWSDVADDIAGEPQLRVQVRKYLEYRLRKTIQFRTNSFPFVSEEDQRDRGATANNMSSVDNILPKDVKKAA